jgi:hypothetical protein
MPAKYGCAERLQTFDRLSDERIVVEKFVVIHDREGKGN